MSSKDLRQFAGNDTVIAAFDALLLNGVSPAARCAAGVNAKPTSAGSKMPIAVNVVRRPLRPGQPRESVDGGLDVV